MKLTELRMGQGSKEVRRDMVAHKQEDDIELRAS